MEVRALVVAIDDQAIELKTDQGSKIIIPKIMMPDAKIDQALYITCAQEADVKSREVLNELLSDHA